MSVLNSIVNSISLVVIAVIIFLKIRLAIAFTLLAAPIRTKQIFPLLFNHHCSHNDHHYSTCSVYTCKEARWMGPKEKSFLNRRFIDLNPTKMRLKLSIPTPASFRQLRAEQPLVTERKVCGSGRLVSQKLIRTTGSPRGCSFCGC